MLFVNIAHFSCAVITKNQLLHVYSKKYENDGKVNLVRIVRYSLDGVMLAQVCSSRVASDVRFDAFPGRTYGFHGPAKEGTSCDCARHICPFNSSHQDHVSNFCLRKTNTDG